MKVLSDVTYNIKVNKLELFILKMGIEALIEENKANMDKENTPLTIGMAVQRGQDLDRIKDELSSIGFDELGIK